jgi:hypothetical protein
MGAVRASAEFLPWERSSESVSVLRWAFVLV